MRTDRCAGVRGLALLMSRSTAMPASRIRIGTRRHATARACRRKGSPMKIDRRPVQSWLDRLIGKSATYLQIQPERRDPARMVLFVERNLTAPIRTLGRRHGG